jgi:hypothetical protein
MRPAGSRGQVTGFNTTHIPIAIGAEFGAYLAIAYAIAFMGGRIWVEASGKPSLR